jgi:hypothetical protein
MLSEVPASAVCVAKSSRRGRGIEDKKLTYAGEYSPFERSAVMALRLAEFGSRRYRTGTSGIGCLADPICLQLSVRVHQTCLQHLHVHSHPPGPQVADPQNAADNITAKVVKHQYLPYRVSILI